MAKKAKLRFVRDSIPEIVLKAEKDKGVLDAAAKAIADACNSDSTWGGYYYAVNTDGKWPRARVWNVKRGASDDESRNNRLIKNIDAGV